MQDFKIIAQAIKGDGRLAPFNPADRDLQFGLFIVIRNSGVRLVVDESGSHEHPITVGKFRRAGGFPEYPSGTLLPQEVIATIRGGQYSQDRIRGGRWEIDMTSGTYGVVWEDIWPLVYQILTGQTKGEKR